jgi:HEAT repeat protein
LQVFSAINPLIAATEDTRWQVQEVASEALGKLRAVEAIPALGKCIQNPISNLRKSAVAAMGEIAHTDALPFIEQASNDNDPDVRKLARWSQGQIEAAAVKVGEN